MVDLTDEEMREINKIPASFEVVGARYPGQFMHMMNTLVVVGWVDWRSTFELEKSSIESC